MPKASTIQNNFSAGEFSPSMAGRTDIDRYRQGLETCLNYIPTIQGSITRRPGFKYVASTKTAADKIRLVRFEFSITQAYILEYGESYIRFYRDNGQIETSGSPYEVVSPYTAAEVFDLKFTQSADVLYVAHPDNPPTRLSRTGHTTWAQASMVFTDGPYLPVNTTTTALTATTFTPGAGRIVTAGSAVGINNDTGFQTTDIGRFIRVLETGVWGYGQITARASTIQVTVTIVTTWTSSAAKTSWRLGAWSDTTGYPSCLVFHEDRLFYGGASNDPQRIDASNSSDYTNFAPTDTDATVTDSHALSFTFNANEVNAVRWLLSDEKGLIAGTTGGEWLVRPNTTGSALTPSNITAKRSTTYGSANIQAEQIGKSGLFVQRAGRKVRDLAYFFEADGFRASDLTIISDHVTLSGITQLAHQNEPHPILWAVTTDGVLIGLTYEREEGSFKAGWHRHIVGGVGDAASGDAVIESVAVIPSADGTSEEVWVSVKRYVNGATVRHVEYMTSFFEGSVEQEDAFFVDSGLTYDVPLTISGATKADPCVVTATSHGFSNGDKVLIKEVKGMTELNTNSYLVSNKATNTFEITDLDGTDIDSSAFAAYVSGGEVRKFVTAMSGLTHLEGESVTICADGAVQANKTVASAAITLDTSATVVHIGLGYNSDGKMLRLDAGAADGTAIGKNKRIHRVGFMMDRSLGLQIGPSFTDLTTLFFRTAADKMGRAPALFTGIKSETIEMDSDMENQICWRQSQPLPSTILAIMPQLHTQDR